MTVVLTSTEPTGWRAVLLQDAAVARVLVRNALAPVRHPDLAPATDFSAAPAWNRALDDTEALVWLSDGDEPVTPSFLARAGAALAEQPEASFAVAVAEATATRGVASALSGRGLGCALLLRPRALRAVGGIDETSASAASAQWDLGIRLVEAGHIWVEVLAARADGPTLAERAGEPGARWLYRKHAALYDCHLRELLLDQEVEVERLLRENHLAERELAEELRPQLEARRDEREPSAGTRPGRDTQSAAVLPPATAPAAGRGRRVGRRGRSAAVAKGAAGAETAVIVSCPEQGRALCEAVDSVLAQTAPAREIVVIDGASRDAPPDRALTWLGERQSAVRVVGCERTGAAHARNRGIAATTAPFVVLLDGEDRFEPSYLHTAGQLLRERADLSFVCCAVQGFGGASHRWKPPPHTFAEALGRGVCGHLATVFRRELWERGGGFDESLPAYEDVDFWLRALRAGYRGAILDEALVHRRVRAGRRLEHGPHDHPAALHGKHLHAKELLLERHLDAARSRGEDLFATLLDFRRELAAHAASLGNERTRRKRRRAETAGEAESARQVP